MKWLLLFKEKSYITKVVNIIIHHFFYVSSRKKYNNSELLKTFFSFWSQKQEEKFMYVGSGYSFKNKMWLKLGMLEPAWPFSWDYLCVWNLPWFPHSECISSFLLALKNCKPPASSAVFPVTVITFSRGLGPKLWKYLTQLLTQIGAQGFEKLSLLSLLA
jgi:hypothetical protein